MKVPIFEYIEYKKYLRDKIESENTQRGLKLRIAKSILCQPSYLSQVLNGSADLTLEQASRLNTFFHHTAMESRYFILLLEWARAGTSDLRELFRLQIEEIQESRFHLKKRFPETEGIPDSARQKYYSTWYFAAIHVALSIPGMQSISKLAQAYNLPSDMVSEAIDFLEEVGLIENRKGIYFLTKRRIHLERESIFIQRHHINWRSQALQSVEKSLPDDLHYSNVVAISENDFKKIKETLVKAIENARKIIGPSKEEKVYALTMDFFKL